MSLYCLDKQRFIKIIESADFKKKFAGQHIINPENIKNFSRLDQEIRTFKELLANHQNLLKVTNGWNHYISQNAEVVYRQNIQQLQYIIDQFS